MINFTHKKANEILKNEIDPETLLLEYPKFKEIVIKEFSMINKKSTTEEIVAVIDKYKSKARFAIDKIKKSGQNPNSLNTFLPEIMLYIFLEEKFS